MASTQVNGQARLANTTGETSNYPADDRTYDGAASITPVTYPKTCSDEKNIDARAVASKLISDFNRYLVSRDGESLAKLFNQHGAWRDHLCLTWDLRTFTGPTAIAKQLEQGCRTLRLGLDDDMWYRSPAVWDIDNDGTVRGIRFFATVATDVGSGSAVIRLVEEEPGDWKIFTLYTVLEKLQNYPESAGTRRSKGTDQPNGKNWLHQRTEERLFSNGDPEVLIVGRSDAIEPFP
jgi:hypothetical protein